MLSVVMLEVYMLSVTGPFKALQVFRKLPHAIRHIVIGSLGIVRTLTRAMRSASVSRGGGSVAPSFKSMDVGSNSRTLS
jgi:hypothetical protein